MTIDNVCCILDNGAHTAKIGLTSQKLPKLVPNCIMKAKSERRRVFIGSQIDECRDASGLFYIYCFQKGYLLNWDIQKTVWDYMFSSDCCSINLSDKCLIVTEPQFNFKSIQEAITEIFFEEYECDTLLRTTAADLAMFNYTHSKTPKPLACIVIDTGFSFTHIVPFVKEKKIKSAVRRIDVGGKVLTNHLKELISYRHLNVMDESFVVNQIKEDVCFISTNFKNDMITQSKRYPENTIVKDFVLPDFTTVQRGYVKNPTDPMPEQQVLKLNNERFTVPELLFHPRDVGIHQMGIAEAVLNSLLDCPPEAHNTLLSNIIVCGGCALFKGMQERLQAEIRALAPDDMDVNVIVVNDPRSYAWQGGKLISRSSNFSELIFTKEEYEEQGVHSYLEKVDI